MVARCSPAEINAFLSEMARSGRLPSPHEALLRKSLTSGAGDERPYAHPYHWAAFQLWILKRANDGRASARKRGVRFGSKPSLLLALLRRFWRRNDLVPES